MEPVTVSFETLHQLTVSELNIMTKLFQDLRDTRANEGKGAEADIYATVLSALIIERNRRAAAFKSLEPSILLEENDLDDLEKWTNPEDLEF